MDVFLTFYHWIATWRFEDLDLLASLLAQRSKLYWRLEATWKSVILSLSWVGSWICKFWRAEEAFVVVNCFRAWKAGKVRWGLDWLSPLSHVHQIGKSPAESRGTQHHAVVKDESSVVLPSRNLNSSPGWKVTIIIPERKLNVVFKVSFFGGRLLLNFGVVFAIER